MIKREKESGNASQVDSLLIENAFYSSIAFLGSQGVLRERESGTEIVANCHGGVEISVASPSGMEELQAFSRVLKSPLGEQRIGELILGSASRVCISAEGDEPLILGRFDPGLLRYPPEDAWKMREILNRGVQYSVEGEGTPEDLTKRISQLILKLG